MDIDYKLNIDCSANCAIVNDLHDILSDAQIKLFRKICFDKYLDMPPLMVERRVLHTLLMRQFYSEEEDVMRCLVSGAYLCFGLDEFVLVTGLK